MRFGPVALAQAEGAILAHGLALDDGKLRKGRVLDAADLARLAQAGLAEVIVARPDPGDVAEDAAALRLAAALVPDPAGQGLVCDKAFTGRVNIRATGPGVLALDGAAIARLNAIDPMITLATLPPYQRVAAGMMVGTVKIIAYAVPGDALAQACGFAAGAMRRLSPAVGRVDLIVTQIRADAGGDDDKGVRAVWARVARLGLAEGQTRIVPHRAAAIAAAIAESAAGMILVLTGSATSDVGDVMPAGLVAAGGEVLGGATCHRPSGMRAQPGAQRGGLGVGALGLRCRGDG